MKKKTTIGKIDKLDFPELHLSDIPCKIDTGADNSAIHCQKVRIVERNGKQVLKFSLFDPGYVAFDGKKFEIADFTETTVKNTSGIPESRYVIFTKVILFDQLLEISLTLADREKMNFPILIGRKFLAKHKLLVDVNKKNLSFKSKPSGAKEIKCESLSYQKLPSVTRHYES